MRIASLDAVISRSSGSAGQGLGQGRSPGHGRCRLNCRVVNVGEETAETACYVASFLSASKLLNVRFGLAVFAQHLMTLTSTLTSTPADVAAASRCTPVSVDRTRTVDLSQMTKQRSLGRVLYGMCGVKSCVVDVVAARATAVSRRAVSRRDGRTLCVTNYERYITYMSAQERCCASRGPGLQGLTGGIPWAPFAEEWQRRARVCKSSRTFAGCSACVRGSSTCATCARLNQTRARDGQRAGAARPAATARERGRTFARERGLR
jgi:hypothetical protein